MAEHENGNGNGVSFAGLPAWMRLLIILGPTASIALFLVWQSNTRLYAVTDRIEARIESHALITERGFIDQADAASALAKALDQDRAQMRQLISIARQICLNVASSDQEKRDCVK